MPKRKRESAAQRDERIVREYGGAWDHDVADDGAASVYPVNDTGYGAVDACEALARLANRIAKGRAE